MTPRRIGSWPERFWLVLGLLLVAVLGGALRLGTDVTRSDAVFDEALIRQPIDDINARGWSIETAIDFEETKGPAMIWTYAALSRLLGSELNDLRLISVLLFIAGVAPLLLIARRCMIRGPTLLLVALLYALIPYHAVLGQLVMSESSFVFGMLWLSYIFFWASDDSRQRRHVIGPLLFAVVLSMCLHHRIHAVAIAGAVCLVSLERDGVRSWPWWTACLVAGLSRIPLWVRWGGLVSPEYQGAFDLGFSLDGPTYLAASLMPLLGLLLWPALIQRDERRRRWPIIAGAVLGLLLGVFAAPTLGETLRMKDGGDVVRFLGITATAVRTMSSDSVVQHVLFAALSTVGLASLGALASLAWEKPVAECRGLAYRIQFWMLAGGVGLYALTRAAVFDRYLLAWAVLLPMIWLLSLPRGVLLIQIAMLLGIVARLTWVWLIT
jgi:hypothetical protein